MNATSRRRAVAIAMGAVVYAVGGLSLVDGTVSGRRFDSMCEAYQSGQQVGWNKLCSATDDLSSPLGEAREQKVLELALKHPDWLIRFTAGRKFAASRMGHKDHWWSDKSLFWIRSDEVNAQLEPERRVRLSAIVSLLEAGELDAARNDLRTVVYTLFDSWDHDNLMLAIQGVGLFGREERRRNVLASSSQSVFPSILEHGLVSACYAGSWSSRKSALKNPEEPEARRLEVNALARALREFGPEAAQHTVTRLAKTVGRTSENAAYESDQVTTVLEFLDGYALDVVPQLLRMLEPNYERPESWSNTLSLECAVGEALKYDPQRVHELLQASSLDRDGSSYKVIRSWLDQRLM